MRQLIQQQLKQIDLIRTQRVYGSLIRSDQSSIPSPLLKTVPYRLFHWVHLPSYTHGSLVEVKSKFHASLFIPHDSCMEVESMFHPLPLLSRTSSFISCTYLETPMALSQRSIKVLLLLPLASKCIFFCSHLHEGNTILLSNCLKPSTFFVTEVKQ